MKTQNLKLLYIDDGNITDNLPPDIEPVSISGKGHSVPRISIAGWRQHCYSLAREKELEFDLLTNDVNFDADTTDPQNLFELYGPNVGGLYHGMMALARRRNLDDHGNVIPLAWEIRSLSPSLYSKYPALNAESTRAYGLLRSLLAEPEEDESLIDCIIRENVAKTGNPYNPEDLMEARRSLHHVMEWDLRKQPERHGAGKDAIARLLPLWRSEFLRRLRQGTVKVDRESLLRQIKRLRDDLQVPGILNRSDFFDPFLPISNWSLKEQYGIRLWSMMADHVSDDILRITTKLENLKKDEDGNLSILEWLEEVLRLSPANRSVDSWVKLGAQVYRWNQEKDEGPPTFWTTPHEVQCMVYCFTLVFAKLRPHAFRGNVNTDESIATWYNVNYNTQTFRRPFLLTGFGNCKNPTDFRKTLEESLQGRGSLFTAAPWLREVLQRFCIDILKVSRSELNKKAPGLIE